MKDYKARLELGDELMNSLIKSNNLDFELLYDYASKKLNDLISSLDNFVDKLALLKADVCN